MACAHQCYAVALRLSRWLRLCESLLDVASLCRCRSVRVDAYAVYRGATPSRCQSEQVGAMPVQYKAERYFAMPLQCYAAQCHCESMTCDAFAVLRESKPTRRPTELYRCVDSRSEPLPMRRHSSLKRCNSALCPREGLLCQARAGALQYNAHASLRKSEHCHAIAASCPTSPVQIVSLPFQCKAALGLSIA